MYARNIFASGWKSEKILSFVRFSFVLIAKFLELKYQDGRRHHVSTFVFLQTFEECFLPTYSKGPSQKFT